MLANNYFASRLFLTLSRCSERGRELPRKVLSLDFWIWGEKVGLAIGAGLSGLVLQLVGFQQGAGVQVLEQSETALYGILLMATLLPALVCLLSIPALLCSAKAMSGLGGRDHLSNKAQQSPGLSSG